MDEKGFIQYLNDNKKKKGYSYHVKTFEEWLFKQSGKSPEEANKNDILTCAPLLTRNQSYAYGVIQYYLFLDSPNATEIIETIKTKIIPKLLRPKPAKTINWKHFRYLMEQKEKKGISDKDRVLLNILWSLMKLKQIRYLRKSDIDFEKKVITTRSTDQKKYHVTPETWEALENYLPIERREKRTKLFPIAIKTVTVQKMVRDSFEGAKITPNRLWLSCKEDLFEAGKQMRFQQVDKKPSSRIEKPPKKKKRRQLFLRLVGAIENFGSIAHDRISKIKDEEEFQRILEGYLIATFPDETITREYSYNGYIETNPRIDFAVGKAPKIPIELKFAQGKIRKFIGDGSEQVKEFLKSSRSKKGILVILSKDRGRVIELAQDHSGPQPSGVHVIII